MTDEEILCEAMRLTDSKSYSKALPLWETLRKRSDDVLQQGTYILNECRCLRAMGKREEARKRIRILRSLDTHGQFRLHLEFVLIDDLYVAGKFKEGNRKARSLLKRNAQELSEPRLFDLSYELRSSLAQGLVSAGEFAEGLEALNRVFSDADAEDRRRIRYFRSLAYRHLTRNDEAIADLQEITATNIHDELTADAHYDVGMIYKSREEFARAKMHLQSAEQMKELLTIPVRNLYVALAWVCSSLNQIDEAKRYVALAGSPAQRRM
jgi:tetratricopeptide (TPR) repeat protein